MNDTKEWKEKALRYIKEVENARPVSFYELNSQMFGNSYIFRILQELVAEDFILEHKIETNGLSLDIPLDTVTLYINKIKSEEHKVSAPTLRSNFPEGSCLQTSSKLDDLNSQIQSLKNQLLELNNVEIDLKKKLQSNSDVQKILSDHYRQLHEYNEIKDIGQMLLGKCAEIEGTTTKEMYKKFEVELND